MNQQLLRLLLDAVDSKVLCQLFFFFVLYYSLLPQFHLRVPFRPRSNDSASWKVREVAIISFMDADPIRVLVYCVILIIKFLIPVYIYLFIIFNKGHFGVFDCTTLEKTLRDKYASQA